MSELAPEKPEKDSELAEALAATTWSGIEASTLGPLVMYGIQQGMTELAHQAEEDN